LAEKTSALFKNRIIEDLANQLEFATDSQRTRASTIPFASDVSGAIRVERVIERRGIWVCKARCRGEKASGRKTNLDPR
jgi:hypothetical protein